MDERTFKERTKKFSLAVMSLIESLPRNRTSDVIGRQLLRSATSVGANYRSACRGRSTLDVIAKLGIVEEEADESVYWIELLTDSKIVKAKQIAPLVKEANEIIAMTVASIKTLRAKNRTQEAAPSNPKSKI